MIPKRPAEKKNGGRVSILNCIGKQKQFSLSEVPSPKQLSVRKMFPKKAESAGKKETVSFPVSWN